MSTLRPSAVGVDVQDNRVLLALAEIRGRDAVVRRLVSVLSPETTTEDRSHVLAAVIARALRDEGLSPDTVVVGVPASSALVRRLQVPVVGRRKVSAALAYALEPLVPYAAEDMYVDCVPIREHGGGTDVLAFAVRRDDVLQLVRALERTKTPVDIVGPDLVPLLDAIPPAPGGDRDAVLYLQGNRGFFAVREGDRVVEFRALRGALNDATLQRDACRSLMAQGDAGVPLTRVALVGDARALDLSGVELEVAYAIVDLTLPATVPDAVATAVGDPQAWDVAICLAAQGLGRVKHAVNFRQGDLRPDTSGEVLRPLKRVAALAGAALLIYGGSLWVQREALRGHRDDLRRQVQTRFAQALPTVKSVADARRQLESVRDTHADLAAFLRPGPGVLNVLTACDTAVRQVPRIHVESLTLSGDVLRLTGEVADFRAVSTLETGLAESPMFADVRTNKAGEGRIEGSTSFRLSAKVVAVAGLEGITVPPVATPAGSAQPPTPAVGESLFDEPEVVDPGDIQPAPVAAAATPPTSSPVAEPVSGERTLFAPGSPSEATGASRLDEIFSRPQRDAPPPEAVPPPNFFEGMRSRGS